jgi:general L-amino acid transport system substrate-binding protein
MKSNKIFFVVSIFVVLAMILAACAQPTPEKVVEKVVETVVVEKEGETVVETVVVEKEVEVMVTPEPIEAAPAQNILADVKARGKVACGVHTELPGFGYIDADGNNVGFDPDLCRAVAAAVFGDPAAVEFVAITAAERGPALQTREVDMIARNMTWTSSREAQWGNFTAIMFYDGQGMMVPAATGFQSLDDLNGATVCVTTGTTTEQNLADTFRGRGLEFTAVTFEDTSAVYGAYQDGRCDAATSDKSQLAAVRSGFENPGDHVILPETMSKEPLGPAVPAGDDQWKDIVQTVMWVLINAEELGVTSENVDEMMTSDSIEVKRMLGVEGTFGQEDLGLDLDFAANVIKAVGNYGEIYNSYMGPEGLSFVLDRGLNELWSNGGLIYAPPLR